MLYLFLGALRQKPGVLLYGAPFFLLVGLGLQSCSLPQYSGTVEHEDRSTSSAADSVQNMPPGSARSALDEILNQVEQAIASKAFGRGTALAERAVRMQPNDGRPYFALARIHFLQNRLEQARAFMSKASTLATYDRQLQRAIQNFVDRHRELGSTI